MDRDRGSVGGGWLREEPVPEEAGIPLAALRVEDPELRPAPRWTEPVACDGHLRPLPDDVPPEADPRSAGQLQAQPGRLGDGMRDGRGEPRRLKDDEEGLGSTGQGGQPVEAILEGGATNARVEARRQVHEQQVHRPRREERTGQGEAVGQRLGREDDEPLQPDAAGDRLDRIERPGEVQPGDDGTCDLGLCGEPQGEGGPAARRVAAEGHARRSRQAARSQDGIECRKPGRDDLACGHGRGCHGRGRGHGRRREQARDRSRNRSLFGGQRYRRQRSERLPEPARRGRSPASLEGRERGRHVGGRGGHRSVDYRTDVLLWQEGFGRHRAVTVPA